MKQSKHMSINSHIQLPNGILKYFRDETDSEKKVWYLDLKSGEIGKKPAGRLGTSKGYFSDEMEQYLSTAIESPITALNAKIRSFVNDTVDTITITPDDVNAAKWYIKASMLRSKVALDELYKNSFTAASCSDQENHDDLVYFGLLSNGPVDEYLKSMSMSILINRTVKQFVIPRNCSYEILSHGCQTIVAPISPFAAISLYPPNYPEIVEGYCGIIDDPNDIHIANQVALKCEYYSNRDFVAASQKEELIDLLDVLDLLKKSPI